MRLKFGIRSLIAVAAIGTLLSATSRPALAIDAEITADPIAWPAWAVQAAHMVSVINDDFQRYTQLQTQISQAEQNLKYLGKLASGSLSSIQSLANFAVTAQNQFPTTAGYDVATAIVAAQNKSLPADLGTLANEILGARGNLQAQQAVADVGVAQVSQAGNQLALDAAKLNMEQAQAQDAVQQRAALLDLNSSDPTAGMLY